MVEKTCIIVSNTATVLKNFTLIGEFSLKHQKERYKMLSNLVEARKNKKIAIADMADLLKVRSATITDKIQGKYEFKFSEAVAIREAFFPEYDLAYLFENVEENFEEEDHEDNRG